MFELLLQALLRKKYRIYENRTKDFNLNIVGVRTANPVLNEFLCKLYVFWPIPQNAWGVKKYRITTLPGKYYLRERLLNQKGCAILAPGQYLESYVLGWHQNRYEALVQARPVRVYRDGDRDEEFDYEATTLDRGMFGINIHRGGPSGTVPYVGKWSAGCQVFQSAEDFSEFIGLCRKARAEWGNFFTYTLLEEQDLNG